MTVLKRLLRVFFTVLKWAVIVVLLVELTSFLVVATTNYLMYGHFREGSRAVYDAYTLFLQSERVRPTRNNADGEGVKTVWMFGGSTMRGATLDDGLTIPSLVAAALNGSASGVRVKIVNFGTNSFNSLLETKYLEKALIEAGEGPDVVLFYDGANDAKYLLEHRVPEAHHGYRRVQGLIESYYRSWFGLLKPLNAALYASFTRELYGRISQVLIPLDPGSELLRTAVDKTEARYAFVDKLSRAFGAEFLVVWQPTAWTEGCSVDPVVVEAEGNLAVKTGQLTQMRDSFSAVYAAIRERLGAKPYFVDRTEAFCGRGEALYRADGVHLNDAGRRRMAEILSGLLVERLSRPAD